MLREKAHIEEQRQKTAGEAACCKAEVEADLHVLQLEKEGMAASREVEVYKAVADMEDEQRLDLREREPSAQGHKSATPLG